MNVPTTDFVKTVLEAPPTNEATIKSSLDILSKQSCLAYVLMLEGNIYWSPEINIAMRLFLRVTRNETVENARARRDLTPYQATPYYISFVRAEIRTFIARLKEREQQFAMIYHLDGDENVTFSFSGYRFKNALDDIGYRLAEDFLALTIE